jgi:hypothetical protein
MPTWVARPYHCPAGCTLDKTLFDVVEFVKGLLVEGTTPEFENPQFPIAAVLLNPVYYTPRYPLTSTIATVCQYYTILTPLLTTFL